jgi:hypothetical protein
MMTNWQTWAAPIVVLLTAAIMLYRLFAKKKSGCAGSCGCANDKKLKKR